MKNMTGGPHDHRSRTRIPYGTARVLECVPLCSENLEQVKDQVLFIYYEQVKQYIYIWVSVLLRYTGSE